MHVLIAIRSVDPMTSVGVLSLGVPIVERYSNQRMMMMMDKTVYKKLLKTYQKRLSLKILEKGCLSVEIDGLEIIVKKLTDELALLEETG